MSHYRVHVQDQGLSAYYLRGTGGGDSSRVPGCMVLNPTAPTEALLSADGWQTAEAGGIQKQGASYLAILPMRSLLFIC